MTTAPSIDHALPPVLQRDGACLREGVARRHGRWRNPARTTPRSSLRTTTNQPRHNAQRWVEKVGRSIKGSDTPQLDRDPTGQATLEHSAEQIGLTIRLDADNGTLEGFLADSTAGRLDFENIDTDRAFVRRAPDQLEPILDTFPVHSSLHDRSPPTASARSVSPRPQPGEPSNTPGPNSIVPWFLAPARRATRLRSATSPPVRQQVGGSLFDRRKGVSFRPALTIVRRGAWRARSARSLCRPYGGALVKG